MEMELIKLDFVSDLRREIRQCQNENHVQQVAFSTYHDCFTQVCFTCNKVRTTIKE